MLSHWYNASLEGQRCSAAMIKEPQYLPCSIPLIARIRPMKFETLSALPSVTNTSAQLSPPMCMWRLPSTISSYSCLRCKVYHLSVARHCLIFTISYTQRILVYVCWSAGNTSVSSSSVIPWLWNGINLPPKRSVLIQLLVCLTYLYTYLKQDPFEHRLWFWWYF